MPNSRFLNAPSMQALAHAGSMQCMHWTLTNERWSPSVYSLMTFFAFALRSTGASYRASMPDGSRGRPFAS